jgi:hypothetical protein
MVTAGARPPSFDRALLAWPLGEPDDWARTKAIGATLGLRGRRVATGWGSRCYGSPEVER